MLFYSVIPYKTPWLEINILAPAALPAGFTLSAFWTYCFQTENFWMKGLAILCSLILITRLGSETRTLCFINPVDSRNILAYSPTVPDINNLSKALISHSSSQTIAVISSDYWPLPWYLRRFKSVGYWSTVPEQIDAPIVITSPELSSQVLSKMPPGSKVQYFGLRPDVLAILICAPISAAP
jgi:predicted membrane-bound mannosyltransferase